MVLINLVKRALETPRSGEQHWFYAKVFPEWEKIKQKGGGFMVLDAIGNAKGAAETYLTLARSFTRRVVGLRMDDGPYQRGSESRRKRAEVGLSRNRQMSGRTLQILRPIRSLPPLGGTLAKSRQVRKGRRFMGTRAWLLRRIFCVSPTTWQNDGSGF